MSDNGQAPRWLIAARDSVKKAKQDVNLIRQAGQADIRRGLETVRISDQRLEELNYLEQVLDQNLSPSAWSDEIVNVTGTYLGGSISAFQRDTHHIAVLYTSFDQQKQAQHDQLIISASDTGVSSGSMIYMGAQIERRLEVVASPYKPVVEAMKPEQIGSRQQIYTELSEALQPLDPKYLYMLKGSEEALQAKSADSLSQGAHSMRDLFQQIIEHLAPSTVVKQQPWFKSTSGAPGGVSRKSRLRYILYGAGTTLHQREIEQLDEVADRAKNALDLSIARAHGHDPSLTHAEVELAVDHARFSLLQVLKKYAIRRSWGEG